MSTLYHMPTPTCPHCRHAMNIDDMQSWGEYDLFALAPAEDRASIIAGDKPPQVGLD